MTDPKDTPEPSALRAALIKAGLLRERPEFTLLDESGCKPMPRYRTRALDDLARSKRTEENE